MSFPFLPSTVCACSDAFSRSVLDENLSADKHLGEVDMSSLQAEQKPVEAAPPSPTPASSPGAPSPAPAPLLTLENCLNLDDIEKAAEQRLKPKAWGELGLSPPPFPVHPLHPSFILPRFPVDTN